MNRARSIAKRLDEVSPKNIRFLEERDPFRFLVCVVLSAQTTDKMVNGVAPILFGRYPSRHDLASASLEEVEAIIHPLGFYHAKAKHIIALASSLDGREIPYTIEELARLPGVGRKSANCYVGDILGESAIIVDTHFLRVVNRLALVQNGNPSVVEKRMKEMLPKGMHYRFSMTANLLGREICHARHPLCASCPVGDLCPSRDGESQSPSSLGGNLASLSRRA